MKRKTHEEYVAELAVKNPGVTVVGEYVNAATKIDHLCACGAPWFVKPNDLVKEKATLSCDACAKKRYSDLRTKSHEDYVAQLLKHNPGVVAVEQYKGSKTKIKHKCECGTVWRIAPYSALSGHRCKGCGNNLNGELKSKTTKEYKNWLRNNRPEIKALEGYKGTNTLMLHQCGCGGDWMVRPSVVITRPKSSCAKCKDASTDANVFYIWENTQDPGVYKVGITSDRCADERIAICTRKNGMTANVILMANTPHARDIERRALELGDDPRYPDTIDGYTEFRRYSDAELGEVWRMAVGA